MGAERKDSGARMSAQPQGTATMRRNEHARLWLVPHAAAVIARVWSGANALHLLRKSNAGARA
jgi:hypothetical protein